MADFKPSNGTIGDPERLFALESRLLLDTPAEKAFDRLTYLAGTLTHSPISLISLIDSRRQFFKSAFGLPQPYAELRETPLSHSFCQHVVIDGSPLIVEDARHHPRLKDNLVINIFDIIAYLGMPLTTADGHDIGTLCVIDHKPRTWQPQEIKVLSELASLAMTEIELRSQLNARSELEERIKRYTNRLQDAVHERTIKIRQINQQLIDKERLKTKFLNDLTHELSTPVASLSVYASLLKKGKAENRDHYIEIIDRETKRIKSLIETVNDYNHLEFQTEFTRINFCQLINEILGEFWPGIQTSQLLAAYARRSHQLVVNGNKKLLQLMIRQVITNASHYSSTGRIWLSCRPTDDRENLVVFTISDDEHPQGEAEQGAVIPLSFSTFPPFGSGQSGFGVGLSAVNEIVNMHGGIVEFENQMNAGSILRLFLPAYHPAAVPAMDSAI